MNSVQVKENIVWGIGWGLFIATGFSVFVIIKYIIVGSGFLTHIGLTLRVVLLTYLAGGIVCGAILGIGRPLGKTYVGSLVLGVLVATVAYGSFGVAMVGPPSRWDGFDWFTVMILGTLGGLYGGDMFFNKYS